MMGKPWAFSSDGSVPTVQFRTGLEGFYLSVEDTFVDGVMAAVGILTAGCILFDEPAKASAAEIGRCLLKMPILLFKLLKGDPLVKLPERVRRRLIDPPMKAQA